MTKFRNKSRERRYRDMAERSRSYLAMLGHDHSRMSDYAVIMHVWRANKRLANTIRKSGVSIQEAATALHSVGAAFAKFGGEVERNFTLEA